MNYNNACLQYNVQYNPNESKILPRIQKKWINLRQLKAEVLKQGCDIDEVGGLCGCGDCPFFLNVIIIID
jgi:hypothetical protein